MVTAPEAAEAFVRRVRALGRGELAALRRNAGRAFREARGVLWFHRLLDPRDRANPEVPFLVATLMALNEYRGGGDFGDSMRRLAAVHRTAAVERRFYLLLDSQFGPAGRGDLARRLRQLVVLAACQGIGTDWARLLLDLRHWTHPARRVQWRWAESFYDAVAAAEEGT